MAISLAYPSGVEGGIEIVQMITSCLHSALRKRGGGGCTLWGRGHPSLTYTVLYIVYNDEDNDKVLRTAHFQSGVRGIFCEGNPQKYIKNIFSPDRTSTEKTK